MDTRRRTVTAHERTTEGWTERQTRDGEVALGPAVLAFGEVWIEVDEQSTFD